MNLFYEFYLSSLLTIGPERRVSYDSGQLSHTDVPIQALQLCTWQLQHDQIRVQSIEWRGSFHQRFVGEIDVQVVHCDGEDEALPDVIVAE